MALFLIYNIDDLLLGQSVLQIESNLGISQKKRSQSPVKMGYDFILCQVSFLRDLSHDIKAKIYPRSPFFN